MKVTGHCSTGNFSYSRKKTHMWTRGFDILGNIKNRKVPQHDTLTIKDIVTRNTINKLDTDSKHSKDKQTSLDIKDIADIDG